jgi:hypothetical protein
VRRLAALAPLAALVALPGCGSDQTGTSTEGPDPASITPADAPFFAEAVVRPEGDQRDALDSALSKLLVTDDPGGFIAGQLDSALAKEDLTYEDDVRPWLGPRAGFFTENFKDNADGAAIVATTDAGATQDAIDKAAAADRTKETDRTYRGVDYMLDGRGNAAGIVSGFFVAGTQRAFEDVVDTTHGGDALADSGRFRSRRDSADEDRFAFVYADPKAIVDALTASGDLSEQDLQAVQPQLGAILEQPVTATLSATSSQLALQTSTGAASQPATNQSPLLAELPGDAWLSLATTGGAQALQGISGGPAAEQLRSQLGFDIGGEISDWVGDLAFYMRGTSMFGLGGALVLETNDEGASQRTLAELQGALGSDPSLQVQPLSGGDPGFTVTPAGTPVQIQVTQRDGRVVVGLGSASVDDVFSTGSRLGDTEAFDLAVGTLPDGFAPTLFIAFPPLFSLVNSLPDAANDPDYLKAKPYLDALDYLVTGLSTEDGVQSARFVLGLRDSTEDSSSGASPAAAVLGG